MDEADRRRAEAARWRAKAAAARARARALVWESDPELRAQVEAILALPPVERVLGLQTEAEVFARAVLIRDIATSAGRRPEPDAS